MPTVPKGMWLILLVAVVSTTADTGTVAADATETFVQTHPRTLQQARPSTMNLPILEADDMERGFSYMARSNPRPHQQKQQQQQRGGQSRSSGFFGRKLLQSGQASRRWGNQGLDSQASSKRGSQPWSSRPLNSNLYAANSGRTPSNSGMNPANQYQPVTWDNTGIVGGSGMLNPQAGSLGGRQNSQFNVPTQAGSFGSRGNIWANNKGDRSSLQELTGNTNDWSAIRAQPITATGTAGTLSQGMRRRGNARAAAQSLAQAYSAGQVDAAAQAVASAATVDNSAETVATAEAVAEATVNHPNVAPALLARSAGLAVSRGQTNRYARTMADAFTYAKRKKTVPQFTNAVADAIATGGAPTRYAYGQAIAIAIADGGEGQAAVAEATATAFCKGGSTATAWAEAYAVALSQNSQGCLVLNQAKALAKARCGAQGAEALSSAEATSTVLGFCGLMDMIPGGISYNWAGGNSGSSSNSNGYNGLLDSWRGK